VVFGALLVLLFVGFAIAEGIGQPSVPDGDVAKVEGVPDDFSSISEAEFKRALVQQASQGGQKKTPKPGTDKYEELKKTALGELLDTIWISGEAEELEISVTDKQIEQELEKIKEQNFPTEKAYTEFLKTSGFNQKDVDKRVELQVLSTKIQEQVSEEAPSPSKEEISAFYEESKDTQFTTKTSRDIRIITNKNKGKVDAAKKALEADSSPANWKKVAAEDSEDFSTNKKGGLQKGLTEELLPEPLKKTIFSAATGELIDLGKYQGGYTLVEVVKLNPEKVQSLKEVESQISTQLAQQKQQEFFSQFVTEYQSKWTSRTFCASGYEFERCANYKASGHPASAPPACYEADPKTPTTECPAPVTMNTPALPGTITVLKPQGEPLVQRPRPVETAKAGEEGASALPPGAEAPPTGEEAPQTEAPPSEEAPSGE
jgi:peptidyl-prolyl cis-trans isomerase SurA